MDLVIFIVKERQEIFLQFLQRIMVFYLKKHIMVVIALIYSMCFAFGGIACMFIFIRYKVNRNPSI